MPATNNKNTIATSQSRILILIVGLSDPDCRATAGPPNAPKIYQDAIDLVRGFGIEACPHLLPDRAVYRHASAAGASVLEFEPTGKATVEIDALHMWITAHVDMSSIAHEKV